MKNQSRTLMKNRFSTPRLTLGFIVFAVGSLCAQENILDRLFKAEFMEHQTEEVKEELKGKVFGLYFTAKWCSPCQSFTPRLVKFRNDNKEDFQFIMVSWDKSLEQQQQYLQKTKMDVPSLRFDDSFIKELNSNYQVNGIPTLLIFSPEGKLIVSNGRDYMNLLLTEKSLAELGNSEATQRWLKMIQPYQDELKNNRQKDMEHLAPVFEEYKDFPRIEELKALYGYAANKAPVKAIMAEIGRDIAADWDNKKKYLDDLLTLAVQFKPAREGYRGLLEVYSGPCFEELGKASVNNAEIYTLLKQYAAGGGLQEKFGTAGLIGAAVSGNDDAFALVVNFKTTFSDAHAPLFIFPDLVPYCDAGNDRALELAAQLYKADRYYTYSAFRNFVYAAYDGNEIALNVLKDMALNPKNKGYDVHAKNYLEKAAENGSAYAAEILAELSEPQISAVETKEKTHKLDIKGEGIFNKELYEFCYLNKDGALENMQENTFSDTKIFVVYYSHTLCGGCKVVTKSLNSWYSTEASKFPQFQLVYATRGDETREKLTEYTTNSKIKFPILDEKFYMIADIENGEAHPFYSDCDMGVPRFRFYSSDGKELPIKKYVDDIYDAEGQVNDFSGLLLKLKKDLLP